VRAIATKAMPIGHSSLKRPHGISGVLYMIGRNDAQHKTANVVSPAIALAATCVDHDLSVEAENGVGACHGVSDLALAPGTPPVAKLFVQPALGLVEARPAPGP
jgi:hypothetical protein